MLLYVIIFLTSMISGTLGMAGGIILMAFLSSNYSIPEAMILHGIAQATANLSRLMLGFKNVIWKPVLYYSSGVFLILPIFIINKFNPGKTLIYLALGGLPLVANNIKMFMRHLNINRPWSATLAGLFVTITQLISGASGPILDVFYINTNMNRHQIISSKAATQTLSHLVKISYFFLFISGAKLQSLSYAHYLAIPIVAILGTWVGKKILEKITESQFKKTSRNLINVLCIVLLGKAVWNLLRAN